MFGTDYNVNTGDPSSRKFTVIFISRQANSTENIILIADDEIFEGRECFRLRICVIRFIGQAAQFFRAQHGVNNTFIDICIEDDDIIQVNWTTSRAISVTEGDVVRLRGEAFGVYADEIAIGVDCSETIATDVEPAFPGRDFIFTVGTKLHFRDVGTTRSLSHDEVVIPIINDECAEPRESFICTLQGGTVDSVQAIFPSQVNIEIRDDDELIVHWAKDFYEFQECELATVELVTESKIEAAQVAIQGHPRRIPDSDPSTLPSLEVCGPQIFPGVIIRSSIEQASFREGVFGKAQVTLSGRTDVESTRNDFIFTPASKSAFESFNIINDSVLEFDELLIATFDFGPEITSTWKVRKGTPSTTYILIRDKNFVEVIFKELSYSVTESAGQVSLSLCITGQVFIPLHAVIEVTDGTATDPADYSSAGRYRVEFCQATFTDTDTPAPFACVLIITINITDDTICEGQEYFQARIVETSDSIRMRIGQRDTVNVTITDDDIATVSFSPQNYTVSEGTPAELTIVLDKPSVKNIRITVTTMDITAHYPNDYTGRSFSVINPAGSTKVTLVVDTLTDHILEDAEHFIATLAIPGAPDNVVVGSPNMAFVTITDTTTLIPVRFNPSNYTVKEGVDSNTVISLEALVDHPAFAFTVTALTRDGTATRGSDYEGASFTVTFPAGVNVISFNVTIINDNIAELAELFTLDLEIPAASAAMGVIKGSPDTATVNIMDNEVVAISFSPQNYTVPEGTPADIMIVLDKPSPKDINITVTTMDITAEDPDDYTGGSFTVLIPAGTMKVTVSVITLTDNLVEDDEYLKVTLSLPGSPEAVVYGSPNMAFVTITDETHACTFEHCRKNKNALCRVPGANGTCTDQMSSCNACYFAEEERPLPNKCGSNRKRYRCAGRTGAKLTKCLKRWGSCVKKAFRNIYGKTRKRQRRAENFKCLEFPCEE